MEVLASIEMDADDGTGVGWRLFCHFDTLPFAIAVVFLSKCQNEEKEIYICQVAVGVEKNTNNMTILGGYILDCSANPPSREIASELRWLVHPNLDTTPTYFFIGLSPKPKR